MMSKTIHTDIFSKSRLFMVMLMAAAMLVFGGVMSPSAQALTVQDIRFGDHPDKTRMVLELSDVTDYRVFMLDSPYRLVIDLPRFTDGFQGDSAKKRPHNIRWGHLDGRISRLVIDISKPVRITSTFLLPAKGATPARLVVDYRSASQAEFAAQKATIHGTLTIDDADGARLQDISTTSADIDAAANNIARPSSKPNIPASSGLGRTSTQKPLIILDPGHGGVDPGALGAGKIREKDVVLNLALEVKRQLEATGRFRVKMTRSDDRFLRLQDRVAYARRHKGDLFVSIHADSIDRKQVSGASVYTLSERASDAQTARLARKENQADLIAGVDLTSEGREVASILIDLAMRDTMNQSSYFANTLVAEMEKGSVKTLQNPHRFAGFAVLKAADIPSVLIEAGFLSNPSEAKRLAGSSYRKSIAGSIVKGIGSYFDAVERNQSN